MEINFFLTSGLDRHHITFLQYTYQQLHMVKFIELNIKLAISATHFVDLSNCSTAFSLIKFNVFVYMNIHAIFIDALIFVCVP